MPEEGTDVKMVRIEAKLDTLAIKLDARLDTVLATIDAGDREAKQMLLLHERDVAHVKEKLGDVQASVAAVVNKVEATRSEFETKVDGLAVQLADFVLVRRIVYGVVALILVAVVGGLVGLVIKP